MPSSNTAFSSKSYWDERYASEKPDQTFEWLHPYSFYKQVLTQLIPTKKSHILHLGIGNSRMAIDMHDDGYSHHSCLDYSEVVIEGMKKAFHDWEGVDWVVGDVFALDAKSLNGPVDVCIDKGTFDAFLTGL
jgi:hypothetical protein